MDNLDKETLQQLFAVRMGKRAASGTVARREDSGGLGTGL